MSNGGNKGGSGGGGTAAAIPKHRVIVLPWLKRFMQRFVLPDWTAITIGNRIFAWRGLDEVELAHEIQHVRQWQKYGLGFVPRYLAASRRASKGGGNRYWDNEFEREAAQAGEAARKREGEKDG